MHKWQNSTELPAVWRILLQWRHLSPGPRHQPAFLSVSHCLMGKGKWGEMNVLPCYSHSYSFHLNVGSVPQWAWPQTRNRKSARGNRSKLKELYKKDVILWKEIFELKEGLMSPCECRDTAGAERCYTVIRRDTSVWLKVLDWKRKKKQFKLLQACHLKPFTRSLPAWSLSDSSQL